MRLLLITLALVLIATAPGLALEEERRPIPVEPAGEPIELTGWFTDEWCGAGNANTKGGDCARHCVNKGAELVLFSDGKIYRLHDGDEGLDYVGRKVVVRGRMMRGGRLKVETIRPKRRATEALTVSN